MMPKYPYAKIALILWLVFSALYVASGEYQRLKVFVYQRGLTEAVAQVITQAQKCEPFPVFADGASVNLINAACLQNDEKRSDEADKK